MEYEIELFMPTELVEIINSITLLEYEIKLSVLHMPKVQH